MALNLGLNAVGGDPRVSMDDTNLNEQGFLSSKHRLHHDPAITFKEYHHYTTDILGPFGVGYEFAVLRVGEYY